MNYILLILLIWAIFAGAWMILSNVFRSADVDKIRDRLAGGQNAKAKRAKGRKAQAPLISEEDKSTGRLVLRFLTRFQLQDRLRTLLEQAGLKWKVARLIHACLALFLLAFAVGWLMIPIPYQGFAVLPGLLAGGLPLFYVRAIRGRRLRKFEEQLPDAIDLFTRTMRAGHNIHSGLETMAAETADPVRMEFRKLVEELALGSQVEPALHGLGRRVPLIDLKFFITSLILQRQTGANMVAVLENLATLVRERLTMAAKLKAHTAQQRFSAALLCVLPVVVGLAFWILKPEYTALLWTDPTGQKFLTYAIISEIVGILIIRKIASVRV